MKNSIKFATALFCLFLLNFFCFNPPIGLSTQETVREASFYQRLANAFVQCQLCPRQCLIAPGKRGFCAVRQNREGKLYTLSYAKPVSLHVDPIEKKPLFHFYPSSTAFSLATAGCNLKCKFCQNWQISQCLPEDLDYLYLEPQDLVNKVKESGSFIIAYTYTEPTIFYEYMLETAKLARAQGLKNVMHSNGYINPQPLKELTQYLDAANIDLKGFTEDFYAQMCEGRLDPVLVSLKILKEQGVHLEITNLILSGFNDDSDTILKMCLWIKENLGPDVPLHFSRAFPMYKLLSLTPTPPEVLENARKIALDCGLKYVYIGNLAGSTAENTWCAVCKQMLIERRGYFVQQNNIVEGKCKFCGVKIEGVWN